MNSNIINLNDYLFRTQLQIFEKHIEIIVNIFSILSYEKGIRSQNSRHFISRNSN